jgi:hypothetical protein
MSQATQNNFEHLVGQYFQLNEPSLSLSSPAFKRDGYIITATMRGSCGRVEMRCGPAEYHVEVFVYTDDHRWTLSELMSNDRIRNWLLQNRPSVSERTRLEVEIDCAFSLLVDGLKAVDEFKWLYGSTEEKGPEKGRYA